MTKKMMIALASVAVISTSAHAGNQTAPAQEADVMVLPEMTADRGSLSSSGGNGTVVLGLLGLLILGGVAAGGGS